MPTENDRPDVAVFIDFENVYVSVRDKLDANPNFEMIMDRCEDFGRVVIARAYADWYRYPRVTSALYANSIEPMYVPTYYYDRDMGRTGRAIKNSVDMNLCVDAMKVLFTNPNIRKFVLVTGDRDFIPMVNSIRQQGKDVIVIGVGGAASAHLAQSADEFIFYEALVGKPPTNLQQDQPRPRAPERGRDQAEPEEAARAREAPREKEATPEIYDVLVQAIHLARERGYVCSFGSLKLLMKELMGGDFKEARYKDASGRPFAKFKDFVLEAERRGKVQVFTSGTVNEVFLPGEDPYKLSQFAQDIKEEPAPPLLEEPPLEVRPEARPSSANGRRRRRRPRGGQRPSAHADELSPPIEESSDLAPPEELVDEVEEDEEVLAADLPALDLEPAEADAIFDELLDRVEAEEAESRALETIDSFELMAPDLEPSQVEAAPQQQAPLEPGEPSSEERADGQEQAVAPSALQPVLAQPQFTEDEWRLLREVVLRHERPLSFVQIHDALRDARNSAGIVRTNEELRSLIKQAINTGMLERSGKGSRITYRLAPPSLEAGPAEEQPAFHTPVAEAEAAPLEAEPVALDEPSLEAGPAEEQPAFHTPAAEAEAAPLEAEPVALDEPSLEAGPAEEQPAFHTPAAEAEAAPLEAEPVALGEPALEAGPAEQPETPQVEAAPGAVPPSEMREPVPAAEESASAEQTAAPRQRRRRAPRTAPADASTPEPASTEAPAPKPRRTRRKKTDDTDV